MSSQAAMQGFVRVTHSRCSSAILTSVAGNQLTNFW